MLTTCFSPGMLRPFCVAFVKGWRRSLAALICCEAIRSLGIDFAELTDVFKVGLDHLVYFKSLPDAAWQASIRVVYATVGRHSTIKEAVWANRGVFPAPFFLVQNSVSVFATYDDPLAGTTLAATIRRPPNAMNFLRQLNVLKKSGDTNDFDVLWLSL